MNHTTNYNLPQWEDADRVTREDVNGALSAVDAAIKGVSDTAGAKAEFVYGTYISDEASEQFIPLGFRPRAVLMTHRNGTAVDGNITYGGLVFDGYTNNTMIITDGGFIARNSGNYYKGNSGGEHFYVALR